MNGTEIVILLLAYGVLVGIAHRVYGNLQSAFLYPLLLLPILALAIEGATQFLTCDETYMILELENTRVFRYRQWNMGGYRTSILFTGSLVHALQDVMLPARHTAEQLHALTKAIHWLLGFGVLTLIHEALRKFFIPREQQRVFFVIFFGVALLLPTNILAFKVANYDLLSMMLGMLSITLTLGALKTGSFVSALVAVVVGAVASQEKIIASPFFALATYGAWFIAATWGFRRERKQTASTPTGKKAAKDKRLAAVPAEPSAPRTEPLPFIPWGGLAVTVPLVLGAAVIPVTATWTIVDGIHGGLVFSLMQALAPLTGYLSVAADSSANATLTFLASSGAFLVAAIIASAIYRVVRGRIPVNNDGTLVASITAIIVLVLVCVGMYGTYAYTIYVHPYYPTPEGIYLPTKSFNEATAHYMQPTFAEHLKVGVIMSYSVIANGLPTAFWILLVVVAVVGLVKRRSLAVPAAWSVAAMVVLIFPLAYAVTQTPFGTRYLNLFLFVIAVYGMLALTGLTAMVSRVGRIAIVASFLLLTAAELVQFRPIVGSFTPVWNKPSSAFASKPLYGQLQTGFWAGWGEENYLAGRRIVEEYRKPGERIRIHCSYPGDWLSGDSTITFVKYNEPQRGITTSDFYVLSRQAIYQQRYPFPHGQKPLFTIDYGGATMAWVFRGDQLRNTMMFIAQERNGGYFTQMPERRQQANDPSNPQRSTLTVLENGKPLGPAHSPFNDIRTIGKGRYNHWEDVVFFTASDNTDPRINGRTYEVR